MTQSSLFWRFTILSLSLCLPLCTNQIYAQSWPMFRGGDAQGVLLNAKFPTKWSETENVAWKTQLHGRAWSSPVIDGNEIWLTTASEDGFQMSVICVALDTGKILHDQLIFENQSVQPDFHITNTYASPTPVIDEQFVYVHYGAYGTACIVRSDCKKVWERRDLPCNHYRGAGSSPIVYRGKLIFHMDGFDHQYAVALDCKTGQTAWKADRDIDYGTDDGDQFKAFSTPLVIQVGGKDQLISAASKACLALDPETGKEIWRVRYPEHSTTVRPIYDGQMLYMSTGFGKAQMLCIRPDGAAGDVTKTHIVWTQNKGIGSKPSPVLVGNWLFDVTDDGVLCRLDPKTGESTWKHRLGGKFSASLVASQEYLVAFDHDGKGYVFTVADQPQLIAENTLPDGCNASPALQSDSLIVRTTSSLYRLKAAVKPN